MSKESRRAARLARESRRAAGAGRPTADGGATAGGGGGTGSGGTSSAPAGQRRPGGSTASARAGRRERVRYSRQPSLFERYRTAIVRSSASRSWRSRWASSSSAPRRRPTPARTSSTRRPRRRSRPSSSTRLGFVQEDMGRLHQVAQPQRYLYCPPASGNHYNAQGLGPDRAPCLRPGRQGRTAELDPQPRARRPGGPLQRTTRPAPRRRASRRSRTFFDTFPASPLCKIPPRHAVAGHRPVRRHAPSVCGPRLGSRPLHGHVGSRRSSCASTTPRTERLDKDGKLIAPPEDVSGCGARLARRLRHRAGRPRRRRRPPPLPLRRRLPAARPRPRRADRRGPGLTASRPACRRTPSPIGSGRGRPARSSVSG